MSAAYKKVLVGPNISIKEALKKMDQSTLQVLIIVDDIEKVLGIVTDGDVRRAVINNIDFTNPIRLIMNPHPITIQFPIEKQKALQEMRKHGISHLPVVNENKQIKDLLLLNDFIKDGEPIYLQKTTPVVIMAGGKGTRLDPFTKILPKPLIPLDNKPIIEVVMDKFRKYGFTNFIVSLNYKAELIKMYFAENPTNFDIDFITEESFLGTAGGLALAKDKIKDTFILSNCDVITDANLDSLLKYHKERQGIATILAIFRYIKIPYGILQVKDGDLKEIVEKPEYHFIVNSGIYVLEPDILQLIPEGKAMDMPDLLSLAKKKGHNVQVFPVSASWFDIGEWEEYKRAVNFINSV